MKHYQIMTKGRTLKGIEQATTLFSNIGISSDGSDEIRGEEKGQVGGRKGGMHRIAEKCDRKKESSEVLENTSFMRNKKPACMDLQTGNLAAEGL
ncbi:MAG: hypothetical protein Q4D98_13765, partial [Planctomycetia bacterium]|nr:hypothetical protein [Planctomycetia bacterium]